MIGNISVVAGDATPVAAVDPERLIQTSLREARCGVQALTDRTPRRVLRAPPPLTRAATQTACSRSGL